VKALTAETDRSVRAAASLIVAIIMVTVYSSLRGGEEEANRVVVM